MADMGGIPPASWSIVGGAALLAVVEVVRLVISRNKAKVESDEKIRAEQPSVQVQLIRSAWEQVEQLRRQLNDERAQMESDRRNFRREMQDTRRALDDIRDERDEAVDQLRQAKHKINNLMQVVWGLQRELGIPESQWSTFDSAIPRLPPRGDRDPETDP